MNKAANLQGSRLFGAGPRILYHWLQKGGKFPVNCHKLSGKFSMGRKMEYTIFFNIQVAVRWNNKVLLTNGLSK